jgi:hypothetical protein
MIYLGHRSCPFDMTVAEHILHEHIEKCGLSHAYTPENSHINSRSDIHYDDQKLVNYWRFLYPDMPIQS